MRPALELSAPCIPAPERERIVHCMLPRHVSLLLMLPAFGSRVQIEAAAPPPAAPPPATPPVPPAVPPPAVPYPAALLANERRFPDFGAFDIGSGMRAALAATAAPTAATPTATMPQCPTIAVVPLATVPSSYAVGIEHLEPMQLDDLFISSFDSATPISATPATAITTATATAPTSTATEPMALDDAINMLLGDGMLSPLLSTLQHAGLVLARLALACSAQP